MDNKDNRKFFDIVNNEKAEQDAYTGRIASAADRAAREVDYETIAMFNKHRLPLPNRLARIAQDSYIRNCGQEAA